MNKEFIHAIEDIEKEKGISKELMFEAIESALLLAYKKNYGSDQNVKVEINKETGATHVYLRRDIVEIVEDEAGVNLNGQGFAYAFVQYIEGAEATTAIQCVGHEIHRP